MQLELLAPARNKDIGIAAIDCGADAVYIAGPSFGARQAAGNSVEDIAELVRYAHLFSARIYAVVNTILFDEEIPQAQDLMRQLAQVGVDAFIVQDLGILKMELPKVPLFASTQAVIRTPEEARRLEALGFKRLILERQLPLETIRAIRKAVSCDLEFFVHGALCVSYSGLCYLSQKLAGRSANRGACIQACRSKYDLVDGEGKVILKERSILSLKDYRLDGRIGDLVEAGISSFKIEGRLKNASYVKNIVRHYSNIIDKYLESHPEHCRQSAGTPCGGFTPDVEATFGRGYTEAFIDSQRGQWTSADAAKSIGEYIGTIASIEGKWIVIDSAKRISAGDGLAFIASGENAEGMRVESVEGRRIRLKSTATLRRGEKVYRNLNSAFERELERQMPVRLIDARIEYVLREGCATFRATTERGLSAVAKCNAGDPARNQETAIAAIENQLSKISGRYRFSLTSTDADQVCFYPAAQLNAIRRELSEKLDAEALADATRSREKAVEGEGHFVPEGLYNGALDYRANCANALCKAVYLQAGAQSVAPAYELDAPDGAEVMRTKYCIRYELGFCPKQRPKCAPKEPLWLVNNGYRLKLEFDCKNCEMIVIL